MLHGTELAPADALLVVPPFARLDMPHLGVELLAASARAAGHRVSVLYAGFSLAAEIGEHTYHALSEAISPAMFGERVFAEAAWGCPPLGRDAASLDGLEHRVFLPEGEVVIARALLERVAACVLDWLDRLTAAIVAAGPAVVGLSSTFEQNGASIALLSRIKAASPQTVCVIGGANCAGPMAAGLLALSPALDHAFSGESEDAFAALLTDLREGRRPATRLVVCPRNERLDELPRPDLRAWLAQRRAWRGTDGESELLLPFETSRGCWWGQVRHCTFCGVADMRYRKRSPDRIIEDLGVLLESFPSRRVHMVDDIMPHDYFQTLLPRLRAELPRVRLFYEQKSNLTLTQVRRLVDAGVTIVQPGIEALSSALLRRMDKGVLARQNVATLRYARAASLRLVWNLLHDFPGDCADDYAAYPELIPLMTHLNPPQCFARLYLVRFSPYHSDPAAHGVSRLRPAAGYAAVLPEGADASAVAFYFDGDYDSALRNAPEQMARIHREVAAWRALWRDPARAPRLHVSPLGGGMFLLQDSRGLPGTLPLQPVMAEQARAALVGRPLAAGPPSRAEAWALESRVAVELDGWIVPLATADPELLARFEEGVP